MVWPGWRLAGKFWQEIENIDMLDAKTFFHTSRDDYGPLAEKDVERELLF